MFTGEPWEDKDSSQWSQKDAQKILENSPWARTIATATKFVKSEDQSKTTKSSAETLDRGDMQGTDFARVIWWSGRTPRRAYVRMYQLSGNQLPEAEANRFGNTPLPQHIVTIAGGGTMVSVSSKLPPEELKKAAWLEVPNTKRRIEAEEAGVVYDADGKPERIRFHFPRQVDGKPVIGPEDKKVIFRWKLPTQAKQTIAEAQQFEVIFDPPKMLARGESDL